MPQSMHVLDYSYPYDLGSHRGDSIDCGRVLFAH